MAEYENLSDKIIHEKEKYEKEEEMQTKKRNDEEKVNTHTKGNKIPPTTVKQCYGSTYHVLSHDIEGYSTKLLTYS